MDVKKSIEYLRENVTRDSGFSHEFINNVDVVIKAIENQKDLQECNLNLLKKLEEYEWKYGSVDTAMLYAEMQQR